MEEEKKEKRASDKHFLENQSYVRSWIEKIKPYLEPGMRVYLGDGHIHKERVLMICYRSPTESPIGNYANNIDLFEDRNDLKKIIRDNFRTMKQIAIRNNAKLAKKQSEMATESN